MQEQPRNWQLRRVVWRHLATSIVGFISSTMRKTVEFNQYLRLLCKDLSGLLFQGQENEFFVTVEGPTIEIETVTAIPLGFIVNELITNAAKYAHGDIAVRIAATPSDCYSVAVVDDGPGVPVGFDPAGCKV